MRICFRKIVLSSVRGLVRIAAVDGGSCGAGTVSPWLSSNEDDRLDRNFGSVEESQSRRGCGLSLCLEGWVSFHAFPSKSVLWGWKKSSEYRNWMDLVGI